MSERLHAPVPGFASTAELDEALAAYALAVDAAGAPGLLDPAAQRALDAHLADCADCRRELADIRRVVTSIGLTAPSEAPPASLRNRVLSAAAAQPQVSARPRAATALMPTPPAGEIRAADSGAQSSSSAPASAIAWLAAAAAIALAAASGFYSLMLRQEMTDALAQKAAADARVGALEQRVQADEARFAVMNAADVVRIELAGQPDAPAANARVYMSPKKGMVLNAQGLPALPVGRTYQLWVVTKQAPVSIGTFSVDANGAASGVMPISLQASIDPVAVAVTIEPDGGVPAPTGAKVLVGLLDAPR